MMIDRHIPVTYSGFCIKLRFKDKKLFEPVFFNYLFRTRHFKKSMTGTAVGANIQNLSQSRLGNCEVNVPDIETQKRIATILSRYDSLIENYQKQIKLLEEAAQRLYKEWFVDLHFPGHENTKIVDGVPEGWEKKTISQLGEYLNGFAFKPSDWQESGKPIIKIKEMGNGVSNDTPRNNGERVPAKYLVKAGDLLFSWSATLMVIVWSGEEGWLNQHLFKVTPAKGIEREFLLPYDGLLLPARGMHVRLGKSGINVLGDKSLTISIIVSCDVAEGKILIRTPC
jgi:type I restriction enzyme S subunit